MAQRITWEKRVMAAVAKGSKPYRQQVAKNRKAENSGARPKKIKTKREVPAYMTEQLEAGCTLDEATILATGDGFISGKFEFGSSAHDGSLVDFVYDMLGRAWSSDFFREGWLVDVLLNVPMSDGRKLGAVTLADFAAVEKRHQAEMKRLDQETAQLPLIRDPHQRRKGSR